MVTTTLSRISHLPLCAVIPRWFGVAGWDGLGRRRDGRTLVCGRIPILGATPQTVPFHNNLTPHRILLTYHVLKFLPVPTHEIR